MRSLCVAKNESTTLALALALALVLGRYILILLAETAPSRAFGPKGEEYLTSAGKIQ